MHLFARPKIAADWQLTWRWFLAPSFRKQLLASGRVVPIDQAGKAIDLEGSGFEVGKLASG